MLKNWEISKNINIFNPFINYVKWVSMSLLTDARWSLPTHAHSSLSTLPRDFPCLKEQQKQMEECG